MSRGWGGGSTPRWRRLRLQILQRDGWICQLCGKRIDPTLPGGGRNPHPMSAQVHHVHGKALGDDPKYLQAAHRDCNLRARVTPRPKRISRW